MFNFIGMKTILKFIIVFIFFNVSKVVYTQVEIEQKLKNIDNDYKLLEKAQGYLKDENEDKKQAFLISHEVLQKTKILNNKILAYEILASYHYYKYASDSAIFYGKKGFELTKLRRDSIGLKRLNSFCLYLSHASRDRGLIEDSKKWALKGIETAKLSSDNDIKNRLLSNLAITYRLTGNTKKALEILESILHDTGKDDPELFSSIAICYLDLKNFEKALFYQKKALNYYYKYTTNKNRSIAVTLMNIGAIYLDVYKDDEALVYFEKSLKIARQYNYPLIELNNMINIGEVLKEKKEYNKAIDNYKNILSLAKQKGYFKQQSFVYQSLKQIALERKNFKEALKYTEQNNRLNDSVNKLQKDKEISKLEVRYETLKKENEISILTKNQELRDLEIKKQQSQKVTILIAFIIILIPLIGLLILYYQKLKNQNLLNKNQKELGEQKIEALVRNQELKLIRSSINIQYRERKRIAQTLHDRIGGNLAAIKLQVGSVDNVNNLKVIYNQIEDTYQEVRVLSHELIPKKFSDNNFTLVLREYIDNIGKSSDLSINMSMYQEDKINQMDLSFHNELFSVFQELITNTIKHANASKIEVQIDFIDNYLSVIFEDDGKGFNASEMSLGIGLSNIKSRIKKMSGSLSIDSSVGRGTIVNIEIPVSKLGSEDIKD